MSDHDGPRGPAPLTGTATVGSRTTAPLWSETVRGVTPPLEPPEAICMESADPESAVSSIAALAAEKAASLVLVFASPASQLVEIGRELAPRLPRTCRLVACSTAGELSAEGYGHGRVVAVVFPDTSFRTAVVQLEGLSRLPVTEWMERLRRAQTAFAPSPTRNGFGVLLTDGSAGQEEVLMATLDASLPWLSIVGGTVGQIDSAEAAVLVNGTDVLRDSAVLCLVETDFAVKEIVFAHFQPTGERLVVTETEDAHRVVLRLNDEPAAEEYARAVNVSPDQLSPVIFARHPLLLRIGKQDHVRAIASARSDGALVLMSAIEPGSVLTLGRASEDMCNGLKAELAALPAEPSLVLGFDCILRRLAIEQSGLGSRMASVFGEYRVSGFNTLGEQHGGMHVNQTFVGLAFLAPDKAAPGSDDAA